MEPFNRVWSIILFAIGIWWLVDAASVLLGNRNFDPVTLIMAFCVTASLLFKWSIETWYNKW